MDHTQTEIDQGKIAGMSKHMWLHPSHLKQPAQTQHQYESIMDEHYEKNDAGENIPTNKE